MLKSFNVYIKALNSYKTKFKRQTEALGLSLIKLDDLVRDAEDELYRLREQAINDYNDFREELELSSPKEEGKLEELVDALEEGGPPDRDELRGFREVLVDDWEKALDRFNDYIATLEELANNHG